MKQIEIARKLGISKSYLSMIMSGQRFPNQRLARRLSSLGFVNFEAKSSLRGRCPRPLDECATRNTTVKVHNGVTRKVYHIPSAGNKFT